MLTLTSVFVTSRQKHIEKRANIAIYQVCKNCQLPILIYLITGRFSTLVLSQFFEKFMTLLFVEILD